MNLILLIILIALLIVIVFQDFKWRAISWFILPLLLITIITKALSDIDLKELMINSGINLLIVLINLLGVTLLISFKEKRLTNIIDNYLGLGDILFFIILCTLFSPINFILFFLGSILLITLIYGLISLIKQKQVLIPLAGAMSALLITALLIQEYFYEFNFYNDITFLFG